MAFCFSVDRKDNVDEEIVRKRDVSCGPEAVVVEFDLKREDCTLNSKSSLRSFDSIEQKNKGGYSGQQPTVDAASLELAE
ncbi:hypothetical protein D5086_022907 [Populus alba]|uniref:Uncharacterized protein n=1 Tax=Populus alba TaxID=43335 RepID=A0ACC4B958_POPAL